MEIETFTKMPVRVKVIMYNTMLMITMAMSAEYLSNNFKLP